MTFQEIWRCWKKFWFEPTSPLPVCIYRIFLGLLILQSTLVHNLHSAIFWYGPHGVIPIEDVKQFFWHNEPQFDALLLLPPTDQSVHLFFFLFIAATVFFTLGIFTRHSAILVAIGMVSLHHHQPFNINGGDTFMRIASIILCFSDCGKYLSVDRLIQKIRGEEIANSLTNPWPQRLLQVQFAIVYWQNFCCKVSGVQWLDGTAVYYATRLDDMLKFNLPGLNSLAFCKALTWFTLITEFGMWTFVWIKELRYWFLAAAFILHFGIDMSINLPVFEWAFIATLVLFIEPSDLERVFKFMRNLVFANLEKVFSA